MANKGLLPHGIRISKNRNGAWYVKLVLLALILGSPLHLRAQYNRRIQSFGTSVGGTLLTPSVFANPVSSQYHLFLHHRIRKMTGEVNLGLGFLSSSHQQSRLFSLEYRLLFPLKSILKVDPLEFNPRWETYLYAGLGVSHYQRLNVMVQDDPLLRESDTRISNSSLWDNGSGWVGNIPVGVGADYSLDNTTSLKVTAGYNLLPGRTVVSASRKLEGYFGATVGLNFQPFGNDPDNDRIPTQKELYDTRTFPDNPDTDGDGLGDGEEFFSYSTDPLNKDTDGDGLSDGQEVLTYHTDPLLIDTDGGLASDGEEVKRSGNPLAPGDDRPEKWTAGLQPPELSAEDIIVYRSFPLLHYKTLGFKVGRDDEHILRELTGLMRLDSTLAVTISGYADRRGNRTMNRSLSNLRSWYVTKYLFEHGVETGRIHSRGFGEEQPAITGTSSSIYAANRRTVITLSSLTSGKTTDTGYVQLPDIQYQSGNEYLVPEDAIEFTPYSDRLTDNAKHWLQALARFLSEHRMYDIQISGSADPSGSPAMNRMLSHARAASVAKYLVRRGISIERLRIMEGIDSRSNTKGVLIRRISNK